MADYKMEDILALAKMAATRAGKFVADARTKNFVDRQTGKAKNAFQTKSNSTDVVTETDQKSEEMITGLIKKHYPHHKIIGEESSTEGYELTDAPTWIIDPIDGTTNFLHGFPFTCVLVSFAFKKEVVVAVMRDAIHKETIYATKGGGCFMDSPGYTGRVKTSGCEEIKKAYVTVDAGYGRSDKEILRFHTRCRELLRRKAQGLRVVGSCGLNMAYVACGRIDGYVEENCPKIWDFAPGSLMVTEAGGFVGDPHGGPLDLMGRSVMAAATKPLFETLGTCVKDAVKHMKQLSKL
eukprot:CAMPEP_0167825992 /NCGR_PEP_ID=MMETSP0112_2-20121227/9726_1 /TAXON_ID=91324 /ORGANISM="Lotharella globosa, Strain CCCM811" /LENGTH=293 /DNA_ID=CAMNT_0007728265 /DNA_START=36 /DNA_END=917 /DNA_ORIENTATION=+